MTRIKSRGFDSRGAFEAALDDVTAMTVEVRNLEAQRDAKIQAVQEGFNGDILEIKDKIKGLLAQCETYALANRSSLLTEGKKSSETSLCRFGFRVGNPTLALLNRKWKWATVIDALNAKGLSLYVKTKESVDKDALKAQLNDEELAGVGCRIKQAEDFWVEPKLEVGGTV